MACPGSADLIDAGEQYFKEKKQPLFSSHMLDLLKNRSKKIFKLLLNFIKRMKPLGMAIEIELGVTGGEEDGVDNSGIENDKLYTQPQHVAYAYTELARWEKCLPWRQHLVMCMACTVRVMLNCVRKY